MKLLVVLCSILSLISANSRSCNLPDIEGFDEKTLARAAHNIVSKVSEAPSGSVVVVCSKDKENLAIWITHELEKQRIPYSLFNLGDKSNSDVARIQSLIKDGTGKRGFIFLIQLVDASFLFENVGRPDTGLKISNEYLFCDWLMSTPGLIRLFSADADELEDFRTSLLKEITDTREIHITTEKGTDIRIVPRSWIVADGEIFTAPVESKTNGTIFVDGCAYMGPPKKPFLLRIDNGRVINVSYLDLTDKQQKYAQKDLTRDNNSNVLAEIGIGTSISSRWDADMMESEQARGTCHFGFGRNIMFKGGKNESSYHFDLVIRKPTIIVDGKCICKNGKFLF
ncbi:MAG: aminopeptidase [Candidatus Latescibacteria bacterium]|nr:aminopeptidase [Candidatus Latescibacterota bacterium]